ncbi:MAG: ribonuclease P protein component [Clostridia bacterium]|nr:ribonuclease P protein component [Clostridia bacterium]
MKNYAIKEHHLYNKAFHRGERFVTKTVAVYVLRDYAAKRLMLANPEKKYLNRVGLSVGKRLGGAVVRNRAKRLLREGYRAIKTKYGLKTGYLVVLAARDEIRGKKADDVIRDMLRAFRALGMLTEGLK